MEVRHIKKLGGARTSRTGDLEWNDFIHLPIAKLDMIECSCFHQHKPLLYIATKDSQILVFDILTKLLQCKTSYENLTTPGTHRLVKMVHTHNFLSLVFENGEIIVWNSETMALMHVQHPEKEYTKKPVTICCGGIAEPLIFTASHNEQRIAIFDLETFTLHKCKFGSRKPVVGMCVHPTQSVLATCCSDGEIRLWDYKTESTITSVEGAIPSSNKYFLAFNSTGEYFVVGMPEGNICVWGPKACEYDDGTEAVKDMEEEEDGGKMLSFYCSSSLNCLCEGLAFVPQNTGAPIVLTIAQGVIMGWDLRRPSNPKTSALQPSLRFNYFSLKNEYEKYAKTCPGYLTPEAEPDFTDRTWGLIMHSHRNVMMSTPFVGLETALGANICMYEMTLNVQTPCEEGAPLASISHEAALWGEDGTLNSCAFSFSTNSVFFLNEQNLWAYSLETEKGFRTKQLKPPAKESDEESTSIPVGMRTSYARDASFILWETRLIKGGIKRSYSMIKEGKQLGVFLPGKDIAFCGISDENYVALQKDGRSFEVGSTSCDLAGVARYKLDDTLNIQRIFSVSSDSAVIALNCKEKNKYELVLLKKDDGFKEIGGRTELMPGEMAIQVAWQTGENGPLGAVLTTERRVLIIDRNINVLYTLDHSSEADVITSVFWVGYALLCTMGSTVKAFYLDGTESILLTLNTQNNCNPLISLSFNSLSQNPYFTDICGVLSDRIIIGSWSLFSTNVYSRPISLLEPLISAELAYSIQFRSEPRGTSELGDRVHQLLAHFEWQRVSPSLVYRLLAAGLTEEAMDLASSQGAFSTNATQIDANVVHKPNDPQLLCTTVDQTPFYDCLQGETCNVGSSSFQDVATKSYHTETEDLGKSGLCGRTVEMAEKLTTQTPSSVGRLGVNYSLMDTVGLGVLSNYVSANPSKHKAKKTTVGKGTRLSTTVADKPIGKAMWVDEIDTNFPLSTLDNKTGFGGNYFGGAGASANPKTKPVVKTQTGAFCMESTLDELCIKDIDDMEFTKKIDLDVDLGLFDGPLVNKNKTTVVEFGNDYDDCEVTECGIVNETYPIYRAKYNRKVVTQTEMIFLPTAYFNVTKRALDREIVSPTKEKAPREQPKPEKEEEKPEPATKTQSVVTGSPATQKRIPIQIKQELEHNKKVLSNADQKEEKEKKEEEEEDSDDSEDSEAPPVPARRPPQQTPQNGVPIPPRSPQDKRRHIPITHKKMPSELAEEVIKRPIIHKKSPSMSQGPSGSMAPTRKVPPIPGVKAQQRASPQGSGPSTPKPAPVARNPAASESATGEPATPVSGRKPPPPPPGPMQKKSPVVGHRVPVKGQPRPAPRAPILDSR